MSKVIIVANMCETIVIDKSADYIGVDGGCMFCLENNITMRYAIGDFDSLTSTQKKALDTICECIVLPCEKDMTDSEYAIQFANEKGYDEIIVYGVFGGRQDHFLTMFQLLKSTDVPFTMCDENNLIYRLNAGEHVVLKRMHYLSLFPTEPTRLTLNGVKYPLLHTLVDEKDTYLVSNEIIGTSALLKTSKKIIIVQSN